jgi:hypothetical protein
VTAAQARHLVLTGVKHGWARPAAALIRAQSKERHMLPFTHDQFVEVFVQYNMNVWPAQVVAYLLGLGLVLATISTSASTARLLVIPVIWSLIGGSAAFLLQVPQDWLLLLFSGLSMVPLLRSKDRAKLELQAR